MYDILMVVHTQKNLLDQYLWDIEDSFENGAV